MKTLLACLLALGAANAYAQLPLRFQEFQSAKIIQTVDPQFPDALVATYRHGGQARVLVSVSAEGKLTDCLPTHYTHKLFADAAVHALKEWEFEPARIMGDPVPVCIELQFNFEVKGVVVSLSYSDYVESTFNSLTGGLENYAPCSLGDLDRIPVPIRADAPAYPKEFADRGFSGEIAIEFFIDEQGNVRIPFVKGQALAPLANLASDAVRKWKFEPPTRRGVPVLVHVRQVFRFNPPKAPVG